MTVLGKYTKQPREVETYAIQFAEDMTPSDDLTAAYGVIMLDGVFHTEVIPNGAYAAVAADSGSVLYSGFSVTVDSGVPDGFYLAVANTDQVKAISVDGISVPARGCVLIRKTDGTIAAEVSASLIVVATPGDQRVRMFVTGGKNGTKYLAQITASTSEGRVMEDEFTIRVKET